jgi:hypothetical protein
MSMTSPRTRSRDGATPVPGDLLDFAERQARPSRLAISLDGDGRPPVPIPARAAERRVPLPDGFARRLAHLTYPPSTTRARGTATAAAVLDVVSATAVQRVEPRSAVNPHRGYPAAHCFFAATVVVLAGGSAWAFDEVDGSLVPLDEARTDAAAERFARAVEMAGGAVLLVLGEFTGVPARYQELRWSLLLSECGHLSELLVHAARTSGLDVRVQDHFADEQVLAAVGHGTDRWTPVTAVELGRTELASELGRADASNVVVVAHGQRGVGGDPHRADRLAWNPRDPEVPAVDRTLGSFVATVSMPWPDVVFERSAARSNKGFTPRLRALDREVVSAAVEALADALHHVAPASDGGLTAYLLASRVTGIVPGMHLVGRRGELTQVSTRDGMAAVQEAFSYPREEMAIGRSPAAFVITADFLRQAEAGGARGLRLGQLDQGRAMQAAGLALTVHSGFLRPVRSFDPDRLAVSLALPGRELPVYVGLVGESRFTDLLMDVRP